MQIFIITIQILSINKYTGEMILVEKFRASLIIESIKVDKALQFKKKVFVTSYFYFTNIFFFYFSFTISSIFF